MAVLTIAWVACISGLESGKKFYHAFIYGNPIKFRPHYVHSNPNPPSNFTTLSGQGLLATTIYNTFLYTLHNVQFTSPHNKAYLSLLLSLSLWILVFVRKWLSSFMDFPCLHAPLVCWPASMRKVQILSLFRLTFSVGNTNSLLFYLRMYVLSTSNLVVFYLLALDFILLNLHAFVDTQFLVFKLVYNIFLGKKKKKKKIAALWSDSSARRW